MRLLSTVAIVVCALFAASTAQAQWTGKAELGCHAVERQRRIHFRQHQVRPAHESEKWRRHVYVGALYGDNGEFTTAERYEARYQLDYKINDRLSWFGALRGEQDRFSGFVYQATVSTGAAYKFIDSPTTKLAGLARRRLSHLARRSADQDRCGRSHRSHRRRGGERSGGHAGIDVRAQLHRDHQDHQQAARGVRVRQHRRAG